MILSYFPPSLSWLGAFLLPVVVWGGAQLDRVSYDHCLKNGRCLQLTSEQANMSYGHDALSMKSPTVFLEDVAFLDGSPVERVEANFKASVLSIYGVNYRQQKWDVRLDLKTLKVKKVIRRWQVGSH